MNNNYPFPPENYSDNPEYIRKVVQSLRNCVRGKINNTGEFTCTPSASSTVVKDNLCNLNSVVNIIPVTSNAASHLNQLFIIAGDKEFTVNHISNGQTDKTYRYVITG
jgi:hypothetical protein